MTPETVGFDTSGAIRLVPARSDPDGPIYRWSDLPNDFVRGYIRAALQEIGAAFHWLHPDTLESMLADCERFASVNPRISTHHEHGEWFWNARQMRWQHGDPGLVEDFPPIRLSLDQNGKVVATPETKHEGAHHDDQV